MPRWLPWAITLGALLLAGGWAWLERREVRRAHEGEKAARAAQLKAEGFATDETKKIDALQDDLQSASDAWGDDHTARAMLAAEVKRLTALVGKVQLVGVIEAETPPGPAQGTPIAPPAPDRRCLVWEGTSLKVGLLQVKELEPTGNVIPLGVGQCKRVDDGVVLREDLLHFVRSEVAPQQCPRPSWSTYAAICGACALGGGAAAAYGEYKLTH